MFNKNIINYVLYLILGIIWVYLFFTRKNEGIAYVIMLILGIILILFSIFGIINWFRNKNNTN
ncbi:MAG: hypothetical protein WAO56_02620 [Miniphocaeibacter sp.]|uniref:hypothetical protein n=1 Tax=Miniphocaeibacter sp. TaxID=3100973 RepID=UPI0017D4A91B|nr:hypothetical protein [Gallicola sp.]